MVPKMASTWPYVYIFGFDITSIYRLIGAYTWPLRILLYDGHDVALNMTIT